MIKSRSLTLRLVIHILLGLSLAYAMSYVVFLALSIAGYWKGNTLYWDDLAIFRVRPLVIQSIVRSPNGDTYLVPTSELRQEMARTPTLQFAAFVPRGGAALPGSSQNLVLALANIGPISTRGGLDFTILGEEKVQLVGEFSEEATRYGDYNIAVYGYKFQWQDLFITIHNRIVGDFQFYAPVWAAALAVCWMSLRSGLKPLHAAACEAERIDIDSLDQRISLTDVPLEILPLIKTVNDALARLDAGAERQRRFVANSAHELRSPVTILRSRIDTMERSSIKTELARDIKRVQNIVEQLLIAARLGDRCDSLNQEFDLVELLDETVGDYAPLVIASNREIEFEAPEKPILVQGNPQALKSIFANLIDNALRAEPQGGAVVVRGRPDACVEVIDHGEGVAPKDRDMIFEPFWRKSESTPGTGLGLAIVRELVDLHGGSIAVRETPGGGATFEVRLHQILKTAPAVGQTLKDRRRVRSSVSADSRPNLHQETA